MASINIPAATAAGVIVYVDLDETSMAPGDELVYEVTAAATSGAAYYMQETEDDPEQPSEQPDMLKSL